MTGSYALAANISPEMALSRLFTTSEVQASWFANSFLAQISLAQIEQILQGITATLGEYQRVEASGDQYLLIFEQGTVPTRIVLNTSAQITGLLFEPPRIAALDLDSLQTEFTALPGDASLLILKDAVALTSVNADQPLAVGSAFKLLILQVLQQQINAGQHRWEEILRLQDAHRSLPSGRLQDWPTGTPLTLQSLATMMISESDNTATDHLLALVGRDEVEALTQHNRPFLSTREAFVLKDPQTPDPVITSVTPERGEYGERVTLTGTGFDADNTEVRTSYGVLTDVRVRGDSISLSIEPFPNTSGAATGVDIPGEDIEWEITLMIVNNNGVSNTETFTMEL